MNSLEISEFENLDIKKIPKFSFNGQTFLCRVIKVYDGDSITGIIRYHFDYFKISIRLSGIDTCEKTSKDEKIKAKAIEAKNRLIELLNFGKKDCCIVFIRCYEFDKYGRVLADLHLDPNTNSETIQDILIKENLAYKYDGNSKKKDYEILQMCKS